MRNRHFSENVHSAMSDVKGVGGITGINGVGADGQIIVIRLQNISSDKLMPRLTEKVRGNS